MKWSEMLESYRKMVVEASRDHGKSWVYSYAWPLFNVQRQPRDSKKEFHIALLSYSEDQARKNLARIRKQIESNELLKWLLPTSKAYVWDAGLLQTSNNCSIEALGFGSSMRGGHFDIVIVDDPTKDHWTMAITEQENFFYGVVVPATRKTGQLLVVGTPVEKNDLMERLETNKSFPHFKFPCWNENREPLWPEQYTISDLEEKRKMIPVHLFSREYLLKRISAADAKFKEEWIKYYTDEQIQGKRLYRIMTIDPAISPGGDALGASVTGTDVDANVFILDRLRFRGDFKTGVGELVDMMERNMPDIVGFENYSFQMMYKVWLEEEIARRGLSFYIQEVGRDSKKSKAMRIESLQPKLAQGKMFFKEEHKPLIDQLLMWDPLSKNNEDDEIDALAWQVPLWQSPMEEPTEQRREALPGSFNAAFEEIRERNNSSYITKLFSEFRHD